MGSVEAFTDYPWLLHASVAFLESTVAVFK
jgi:hypothetical protein